MHSVFFITLRRLRAPLILIILIFTLSMVGLTLIPGLDAEGREWHMTLFQAFYFVTYTATTIGFGEIPHTFTDTQRLFVTAIIYLSVLGWAYLLGTFLNLAQDKGFQQVIVAARFRRSVAGLREPFFLVCGLGEAGMTVVRSLDRLGYRFTAIDRDERRIQELAIEELSSDAPALAADARSPETLATAGLLKSECRGVLALCNDDDANLAVSVSASLLRPGLPVIGRAEGTAVAASMSSLGTSRVINPFHVFAEHLELAIRSPDTYRLLAWLTSSSGSHLPHSVPPRIPVAPGHWIVFGYGRFGTDVSAALQRGGFRATVIDPAAFEPRGLHAMTGAGSGAAVLHEAGTDTAVGLFAGTDDDTSNLAIAIAARRMNPGLFIIVRQNQQANDMLFHSFGADITMVASQIIADECIAVLRTPLLADFLDLVRRKTDLWAYGLTQSLETIVGRQTPSFWSVRIDAAEVPGLVEAMQRLDRPLTVADLSRSPQRGDASLPCLALLIHRGGDIVELPQDDCEIRAGDRILFAGQRTAQADQQLLLQDAGVAGMVLGARSEGRGWVWRTLQRAFSGESPTPGGKAAASFHKAE
jgi:Trk K+ transport system NAD-binding subunit